MAEINREINISFTDVDAYKITGYNRADVICAGYEGENESTRLNITLPSDWTDHTFYLIFKVQGSETITTGFTNDGTTPTIVYDIPSALMLTGQLTMVIKITSGSQILYTTPIYFTIEKKLTS